MWRRWQTTVQLQQTHVCSISPAKLFSKYLAKHNRAQYNDDIIIRHYQPITLPLTTINHIYYKDGSLKETVHLPQHVILSEIAVL